MVTGGTQEAQQHPQWRCLFLCPPFWRSYWEVALAGMVASHLPTHLTSFLLWTEASGKNATLVYSLFKKSEKLFFPRSYQSKSPVLNCFTMNCATPASPCVMNVTIARWPAWGWISFLKLEAEMETTSSPPWPSWGWVMEKYDESSQEASSLVGFAREFFNFGWIERASDTIIVFRK